MTYLTGYNGTVRTLEQLNAWSQWQGVDPEMRRRTLKLMDDSKVAGRPVGIGGTIRTIAQQEQLALSRHHVVATGGCCTYQGKRYALDAGEAHAAFPGKSYHEPVTRLAYCLAIDFIGDMTWLNANAPKYGLVTAHDWSTHEPWHGQPAELPHSRSGYVLAQMDPLKPFTLPGTPPPAPLKITAPLSTLKKGTTSAAMGVANVKNFQMLCNFWGWRDTYGRTLIVDGVYSTKSVQACISMQRGLGLVADGVYGPQSRVGLQAFLNGMASISAGGQ